MAEVKTFKTSKSNKPSDINWTLFLPTDDRPPDHVPTSVEKSKGRGGDVQQPEMEEEDLEYRMKTDGELKNMILTKKSSISTLVHTLPDKGEKLKATLRRCEAEVERRKKNRFNKGGTICKETLQLSDQSDDGEESPDFFKIFSRKLDEDKDSRTVNAFEDELSFFNPSKGRKMKLPSKGQYKMQLSSRPKQFRCPTTLRVDNEKQKQRISNADKKVSHSSIFTPHRFVKSSMRSSPKKHVPHNPPSRKLIPRNQPVYSLVDDESPSAEKLDDCMKDIKVSYPSRDDRDLVEVRYDDMACLAPEACLSSPIMNFYIQYLKKLTASEDKIGNYHFFNTYFYNLLRNQKLNYKEDSFLKFRKWWKGVNLFEKAYILLPVHETAHWSLGIVCFPSKDDELGPIVLHLDSLGLHNSSSICNNITRFVIEEWRYLQNSQDPLNLPITDKIWENLDRRMEDRRIQVPQQRNDYDCGLFVLFYMERFIKEAPQRFTENDLSMFGKQWFRPEEASNLRTTIHNLLVQQFNIAKQKEKETTNSH